MPQALRTLNFFLVVILLFLVAPLHAEEGGSGHYMPGSMSSFVDGVPAEPTVILRLNYLHYDGSTGVGRSLPVAGLTALDIDAVSDAFGLTALWAPSVELADGWSYAMSTTIPWLSMEVEAEVATTSLAASIHRKDKEDNWGDIILMPIMLNQQINQDFNINYRLAAYAPTGSYQVGRLANTGKNFWTIEPTVALMYFGQKNGREASVFIGADYNFENPDTNYKSGIQTHIDATLAQHFPLFQGLAGVGMNGFWYQQITDDSGDGASFGAFRGRALGIGPVASYTRKVAGHDIIGELKWLHEFENKNRLQGDTIFFKILAKF